MRRRTTVAEMVCNCREISDLRAKLAEVEAERDGWEREHDAAVDEWRRAEARLAEVERERDARTTWDVFGGCLRQETQRRKAAEARLAENEVAFRKMAEAAQAYSRELHKARAALALEAEAHRHTAAARARAEETVAACGCSSEDGWEADAEFKRMKTALARVEALCDQWDDLPNHVRRDIDAFDVICEVRAAFRGPQDEEAAEECPHPDWSFDRTICVGCDSMPDLCVECGWHDCRTPAQRAAGSGRAAERPAEDACCDHCGCPEGERIGHFGDTCALGCYQTQEGDH